jgi:hypothetical protein
MGVSDSEPERLARAEMILDGGAEMVQIDDDVLSLSQHRLQVRPQQRQNLLRVRHLLQVS